MLLIRRGEAATLAIYTGLFEYEEMCFVLNALRGTDLFVDVGANIGAYTVLAAAAVGCRCVAFEPIPVTFRELLMNIRLNDISHLVEPVDAAVGSTNGTTVCTSGRGAANAVVTPDTADGSDTVRVRMVTLDDALVPHFRNSSTM